MALKFEYFAPAFQALNEEITYHPKLQEMLQWPENSNLDPTDKLAVIGCYCDVAIDGYFSLKDLEVLADTLWRKLREKRTEIILP